MTVEELIKRLKIFNPKFEIMILDGFNGGGSPREINLGPNELIINKTDCEQACDCEDREGEKVVIIGYGCY